MRTFTTLALALGLAAVASASDVEALTEDTFTDYVKENELVLAEFYAPWCGHCKALAPEYEDAATALKEKNIKLAKVDCTEHADLCKTFGVEGYPTLKVFRGPENPVPYEGARKSQAIISYMTKQSLPAVSILNQETLEDFKTADKVVLVAYIGADDKKSNTTFTAVADKLRNTFLFGAVHDAEVAKAEGVTAPAVVLYKSFDEGKTIFTETFDSEAIEKFATTASTPLVGEVGPETYAGYMSAKIPLAYIFAETEEERTTLAKSLKDVAELHRGKINFATIDAKQFGAHAGNLNLKADSFPSFAIQDVANNKKFPFLHEDELTAEKIGAFVSDFVAGKIEPSIKSEPVPETQDGPVTIVVAHNYDEIVLEDDKDVLIEFYAPWCGHCKALAPKYDILGQLYIDGGFKDKVTIAKVDATANDVPDEIQGFPTIKLYKAGDKKNPVTYEGARTVEDLIKFVKESGKHGVEVSYEGEAPEAQEPDADEMAEQAPAATEAADEASEEHDEL